MNLTTTPLVKHDRRACGDWWPKGTEWPVMIDSDEDDVPLLHS
jgi:hypothetical protein